MGDHHQVKTSFLFIQLQSPSKARQQPRPASRACLATSEEGYRCSSVSAEDPGPNPEHQTPSAESGVVDASSPEACTISKEEDLEEGANKLLAYSTESTAGDAGSHIHLHIDEEQVSLTKEEEPTHPSDDPRCYSEEPVWILREESPDSMSEETSSTPRGSMSPKVPPKPARASFLYPTGTHEPLKIAPEGKLVEDAKPKTVYQTPVQPTMGTSVHRASSNSWVHSAKHKEEASLQGKAQTAGAPRSPEKATFLSAVIQRSSKLSGDAYRKSVNNQDTSKPAPAATTEPCVKASPPPPPVRSAPAPAAGVHTKPAASPVKQPSGRTTSMDRRGPKPPVPPKVSMKHPYYSQVHNYNCTEIQTEWAICAHVFAYKHVQMPDDMGRLAFTSLVSHMPSV